MKQFSAASAKKLSTCHTDLQLLCNSVLQDMDITILCGYRGELEQNMAFAGGKSRVKFPNSAHNQTPSLAVDVAPYPVNWQNIDEFEAMCKMFEQHAQKLNIDIVLGRDFSFKDFPHIQLAIFKKKGG